MHLLSWIAISFLAGVWFACHVACVRENRIIREQAAYIAYLNSVCEEFRQDSKVARRALRRHIKDDGEGWKQ